MKREYSGQWFTAHIEPVQVKPVDLIWKMILKNDGFDHKKWSLSDADVLEMAAKRIRGGYEEDVKP